MFFSNANPWLLMAGLAGAVIGRGMLGPLSWHDVALAAALVAFEPLQEWLIHVYVLHWKPRRVFGFMIDPEVCWKHRAHHEDPWNLDDVFIPRRTLLALFPLLTALWWAITPTLELWMSALITALSIGVVYEWTHFLVHTTYKPRSTVYKRIFRYHRLHHFKNEHFWYGVTSHMGDRILGTLPHQRSVKTSPTARNIGATAAGDCAE